MATMSMLLMALANKYRSLLLTTGNKSELAVGYTTVYGVTILGTFGIIDVVKRHTGCDDIAAFANLRHRSPLLRRQPEAETERADAGPP